MAAAARDGEKAVVLLSGGIDSATALAVARRDGYRCLCLTFRYGQRHEVEVQAARRVAESLRAAQHRVLDLPLGRIGGSALTDGRIRVPPGREDRRDIPSTYVPARNTIFLAFGLAYAEVTESDAVYIGVNAVDYSGYPDCRPEFIEAFRGVANLATRRAVQGNPPRIAAPLLNLSKARIIRTGVELGVDYSLTVSCYDPDAEGRACARCDSCLLRRKGFEQASITDPTHYQAERPED